MAEDAHQRRRAASLAAETRPPCRPVDISDDDAAAAWADDIAPADRLGPLDGPHKPGLPE